MQFGVWMPAQAGLAEPASLVDLACEAEAADWDGFFLWDHLWLGGSPALVDPWVVLAAVAHRTERIALGPLVTPIPRSTPWDLARRTVAIERLAPGRFILGVGEGVPEELQALGGGPHLGRPETKERFTEGLEILRALIRGESVTRLGSHYRIGESEPARFSPGPSAGIRIWSAARIDGKTQKLSLSDETADGFFPISTQWSGGGVVSCGDIRSLRSRVGWAVDIAVAGRTALPGVSPKEYENAGATWWLEDLSDCQTVPDARKRIAGGPAVE